MFHVIYDAGNDNRIGAVFGKALTPQAKIKLDELNAAACGTNSNFKMTRSGERWSVGEKFNPQADKEYVLILLNPDELFPHRAIGPFQYAESPQQWLDEKGDTGPSEVVQLEPHGWDG